MRKNRSTKPIDGKTPVTGLPASPARFVAPPCQLCRGDDTHTYKTLSYTYYRCHYCKCRSCGHTWNEVTRPNQAAG